MERRTNRAVDDVAVELDCAVPTSESAAARQLLRQYVECGQRYQQVGIVERIKWFLRGMD